MVIDTSALVAILQGEPERRAFIEIVEEADSRKISVATLVEISIILESRQGAEGVRDLDRFIDRAGHRTYSRGRRAGADSTRRVQQIRQGPPQSIPQLRRLLFLRVGHGTRRASSLQRR